MNAAIVMPYFNQKDLLTRAVMGILGQTYPYWTLYLVDDGSEDGNRARQALPKNITKRVQIIEQTNAGCSAARNAALKHIRGNPLFSYVAYCDADDIWDEDHLSSQITMLRGGADMTYANARFEFTNGTEAFPYGVSNPEEFPGADVLLQGDFIWGSTVVQKVRCLEVGDFDSSLDAIENWDMWVRVARAGFKIRKNQKTSMTYTVKTEGNLSAKGNPALYERLRQKHRLGAI